jgi:hypothetical protein
MICDLRMKIADCIRIFLTILCAKMYITYLYVECRNRILKLIYDMFVIFCSCNKRRGLCVCVFVRVRVRAIEREGACAWEWAYV